MSEQESTSIKRNLEENGQSSDSQKKQKLDVLEEGEIVEVTEQVIFNVNGSRFPLKNVEMLMKKSKFFNAMFSGKWKESKEEEIKISNVFARDFRLFLNVLDRKECCLNIGNISRALKLMDFFDCSQGMEDCKNWFLTDKMYPTKQKFDLLTENGLDDLKAPLLSQCTLVSDVTSVLPEDPEKWDEQSMREVLTFTMGLLGLHGNSPTRAGRPAIYKISDKLIKLNENIQFFEDSKEKLEELLEKNNKLQYNIDRLEFSIKKWRKLMEKIQEELNQNERVEDRDAELDSRRTELQNLIRKYRTEIQVYEEELKDLTEAQVLEKL
ncbi:hypothetical protein B9Z55_007878 [Caenorhabditis nigoni]|uniref:BTB domain-containing protein n=1 Tax=Caenorhabditis nigoni TaxID=1611254 RepID=A0A2G5VBL9_9PELO|nr:hypothetical protein B9Z55_007878 [Caenorhabditis nigoni]